MSHRIALACLLAATLTTAARGAVIDQSFVPDSAPLLWADIGYGGIAPKVEESQTFRVGLDGRLTGVDIDLMGGGDSLLLEIRRVTSAGLPSAASQDLLGAAIATPGTLTDFGGTFVRFNLGDHGPMVAAGETLAIVVMAPGSGLYQWGGSSANPYADGSAAGRSSRTGDQWASLDYPNGQPDLAFRTYVEPVPEPSTVLIFAAGGLGAWSIKRRRQG